MFLFLPPVESCSLIIYINVIYSICMYTIYKVSIFCYLNIFPHIFLVSNSSGRGRPRPRCSCCRSPGPIRVQYSGHVTCIDQSEASITWVRSMAGIVRAVAATRVQLIQVQPILRTSAVKIDYHDNNILLWNEEQQQEDNSDKVVEGGQEAPDDALVDGVSDLH